MRRLLTAHLLLPASLLVGLVTPSGAAQAERKFDVTSVKRNTSGDDSVSMTPTPTGIAWANATLQMMMRLAYRVQDYQILDAPSWINTTRFDVVGKTESSVPQQDLPLMLRALLEDRFKLSVRSETRELPVYALIRIGDTFGPSFRTPSDCARQRPDQPAAPQTAQTASAPASCGNNLLPGNMSGRGVTMLTLTVNLSVFVGRTVIDRTGFADTFDCDLTWSPDFVSQVRGDASPEHSAAGGPSLFSALQEQLGLKLESTKGPVRVVAIEHVELPTPD
jgi:uncharacterized protein (TIGR03435 family)